MARLSPDQMAGGAVHSSCTPSRRSVRACRPPCSSGPCKVARSRTDPLPTSSKGTSLVVVANDRVTPRRTQQTQRRRRYRLDYSRSAAVGMSSASICLSGGRRTRWPWPVAPRDGWNRSRVVPPSGTPCGIADRTQTACSTRLGSTTVRPCVATSLSSGSWAAAAARSASAVVLDDAAVVTDPGGDAIARIRTTGKFAHVRIIPGLVNHVREQARARTGRCRCRTETRPPAIRITGVRRAMRPAQRCRQCARDGQCRRADVLRILDTTPIVALRRTRASTALKTRVDLDVH